MLPVDHHKRFRILELSLLALVLVGCGGGGGQPAPGNPYGSGGAGSANSNNFDRSGAPSVGNSGQGAGGSQPGGNSADLERLTSALRVVIDALNGMTNEYEGLAGSGQQSIQLKRTEEMYQRMSPYGDSLRSMQSPTAEEARAMKGEILKSLLDAIKRAELAELHLERNYDLDRFSRIGSFGRGGHEIHDGIRIARSFLDHSQRNLPASEKLTTGPPASIGGPPPTNRRFSYLRGLDLSESQYRGFNSRNSTKSIPWRLRVDEPVHPYTMSPEASFEIDIPKADSGPSHFFSPHRVLYPQMASVHVGLGSNERIGLSRVVYSLNPRRRKGVVKGIQLQRSEVMALSADGKYFAGRPENTDVIGLYDVENKEPVAQARHIFDPHGKDQLMFAADNRLVVFNGDVAKVWTTPDLTLRYEIDIKRDYGRSVWNPGHAWALSPGGRYLAVPGRSGFAYDIVFYDLTTGEAAAIIEMGTQRSISYTGVAFSRDGKKLAVLMDGAWDTWIQIWDVVSGRILHSYKNEGSLTRAIKGDNKYQGPAVDWFPDGKRILLYGKGIFNTESGIGEKMLASNVRYRIALLGENQIGVVKNDLLTRFDLDEIPATPSRWQSEQIASEAKLADNPFELAPKDGKPVATIADRTELAYLDVDRNAGWSLPIESGPQGLSIQTKIEGFTGKDLYHLSISADHKTAVAGYTSEAVRIWDGKASNLDKLRSWVEYAPTQGAARPQRFDFPFPVGLHAVSPTGNRIATRDLEGFNRFDVWDLSQKSHLAGFFPYDQGRSDGGAPILWCDFLDDDHLFTLAANQLTFWSVPTGKAIYEISTTGITSFPAFSPQRNHLAFLDDEGLTIIQALTGRTVAFNDKLPIDGKLVALAFSPSGESIGVLSEPTGSGELALIDVLSGSILSSFPVPMSGKNLQFAGEDFVLIDGGYLISLKKKAVAWIYHLDGLRVAAGPSAVNWFLHQSKMNEPYTLKTEQLPTQRALTALSNFDPPIDMVLQPGGRIALDVNVPSPPNRGNFTSEVETALAGRFAENSVTIDPTSNLRLVVRGSQEKTGDGITLSRFGSMFDRDSDLDEERVTWTLSIKRGDETLWQRSTSANNTGSIDIEDGVTGSAAVQQAESQLRDQMWSKAARNLLNFKLPKYVFGPEGGKGLGSSKLGE